MKLNTKNLRIQGVQHGQELFVHNIHDIDITENMEVDEFREEVFNVCSEADDGYRQYSPFEFFCAELNKASNSEDAWEAYEKGVFEGIESALDAYLKTHNFEDLKRDKGEA